MMVLNFGENKISIIQVSITLWLLGFSFIARSQVSSYSVAGSGLTTCSSASSTGSLTPCGFNYDAGNIKFAINPTISGTTLSVSVNKCTGSNASGGLYLKMGAESQTMVNDIVCGSIIAQSTGNVTLGTSTSVGLSADLSSLFTSGTRYFTVVYITSVRSYTKIFTVTATPTLNQPLLTSPTVGQSFSSTTSSVTLQWNKNTNPVDTNYQLNLHDLTSNTYPYTYSNLGDVSSQTVNVTTGHNYQWVIYATKSGYNANESGVGSFLIQAATVAPITIGLLPSSLPWNTPQNITWTAIAGTGNVSIELTNSSGNFIAMLADNISNTSPFVWSVGKNNLGAFIPNLTTDSYKIKMYPTGTTGQGLFSNLFSLTVPTTSITISNPTSGSSFSKGHRYPINWLFENYQGSVSIELTSGANSTTPVATLFDPTLNDGTESWLVPNNLSTGQYRIKIYNTGAGQNGNPTYVGYSAVFNVVAGPPLVKKIIGYLPTYQWGANFNSAFLDKFTHINLSFINPVLSNGAFQTNAQGDYVWSFSDNKSITDAKARISTWLNNGFKGDFFLAIGGAQASSTLLSAYRIALNSAANRTKLLNGLNKFLLNFDSNYKIKGIDMDLEYTAMNIGGYNPFVQLLADDLHTKGLQISAATEYKYPSGVYVQNDNGNSTQKVLGSMIDNTSLSKLDWLNMMSYDYAQSNDVSANTLGLSHSPYTLVQRDFAYWNTTRGLSADKIVCGFPIYGRESGGAGVEIAYRDVKCKEVPAWYNPDIALRDNDVVSVRYCYYGSGYLQKPSNITVYQNGKPTLLQKYTFSNQMAGIMFWAIGNDIWEDENQSLLSFLPKKCPQSKTLNYTYATGNILKEKAVNLSSNGIVNSGAKVIFQGEKSINMTGNFQAKTGSVFTAEIKNCNE